jgi:hypothetical protein
MGGESKGSPPICIVSRYQMLSKPTNYLFSSAGASETWTSDAMFTNLKKK